MRSLALITPWPPQRSGIADYALDLATGLTEQGVKVDVYTTSTDYPAPPADILVRPLEEFAGSADYDHTVYQMGNCSDFHAEMLPVLFEHPGIVHLHDLTLHHLIAFFLYRGDARDYYRVLQHWYGPDVAKRVQNHNRTSCPHFWDSPLVGEVPFFDPVLEAATGCIVHSQHARRSVLQRFAGLPTAVIPQVYRQMTPTAQIPANNVLQIGVFGIVQKHKHIDLLLQAVAECNAQQGLVHLHIGGELDRGCEGLPELAESLGLKTQVTFYGRMEEAAFIQLMRKVDLCISLRYPTMGETSAVVSRAVQLGLPTMVNDIGWYAELPDCVRRLPVESSALKRQLIDLIRTYAQDRSQLRAWALKCRALAASTYSFEHVCNSYIYLLSDFDQVTSQPYRRAESQAA
jgi:glycosyltransferase involved in cell wall biosynthesis